MMTYTPTGYTIGFYTTSPSFQIDSPSQVLITQNFTGPQWLPQLPRANTTDLAFANRMLNGLLPVNKISKDFDNYTNHMISFDLRHASTRNYH